VLAIRLDDYCTADAAVKPRWCRIQVTDMQIPIAAAPDRP